MSETPVTPVAETPPAPTENNAIKQMREQLNQVLAEKKAADERAAKAEALITESERAKLADNERLQLELADERKKTADLGSKADRASQLEAKFTQLYDAKIEALPTDKQEEARALTSAVVDPEAKFDMLQRLEHLLVPAVVPKVGGAPSGTSLPGNIPPVHNPPAVLPPSEWGSIPTQQVLQEIAQDPARQAALRHDLPKA